MGTQFYLETGEKLNIRIRAHTLYATNNIEDYLLRTIEGCEGCRLLEIGCGNGNFFPTYSLALRETGLIIGFDVNTDLLVQARRTATNLGTPAVLIPWDFDVHPYPLLDEELDLVIAPFSAYYSRDVPSWIDDTLRIIKTGGRLLLLGPTRENARELHDLNAELYGVRSMPELDEASEKLHTCFLPYLRNECGNTTVGTHTINRQIEFPSAKEFADYYLATWLFEKTRDRMGKQVTFQDVIESIESLGTLTLSKQVICIEARKG